MHISTEKTSRYLKKRVYIFNQAKNEKDNELVKTYKSNPPF